VGPPAAFAKSHLYLRPGVRGSRLGDGNCGYLQVFPLSASGPIFCMTWLRAPRVASEGRRTRECLLSLWIGQTAPRTDLVAEELDPFCLSLG
jgi:hypothetical protein